MNEAIENKKDDIIDVCKKHYVKSLYLFGSATGKGFNDKSDFDFLYEIDTDNFKEWATGNFDYADNLFSLESSLIKILNRKIDPVPNTLITNRYLKKTIEQSKQLIYAA
jgi:uncharacterized protein